MLLVACQCANGHGPLVSALLARNNDAFLYLLPHYKNLDDIECEYRGDCVPLVFLVARIGTPELMESLLQRGVRLDGETLNGDKIMLWAGSKEMKHLILEHQLKKSQGKTATPPVDELEKTAATAIVADTEFANWTLVRAEHEIEFLIPPTLEVRGGSYKAIMDVMLPNIKRICALPDATRKITVQQSGLSDMVPSAFKTYVRLMYSCSPCASDEGWKFGSRPPFSDSDVKAFGEAQRKITEAMLQAGNSIRNFQRILRWDGASVVPIGGGYALSFSYLRQLNSNPPVEVVTHMIGDGNRMHEITFSYRREESATWKPIWENIKKSVKIRH